MLSYVFRYKFSLLLAIAIAFVSLIPSDNFPESSLFSITFMDKIVHFSMYSLFGFVALLESRCQKQCVPFHMLMILAIFIMSATIEVLQATVVSTRAAEWLDLVANFSGLVCSYFAYRIFRYMGLFGSLKS